MQFKRKKMMNMPKNYLFDLDGTLLPLDEEAFIKKYFGLLGNKFAELGLNPETMIKRLWLGTKTMIENTGQNTNEDVFWEVFYPENSDHETLKKALEQFYQNEFDDVKSTTRPSEASKKIIEILKNRGKTIVLATNPIFPLVATKKRIKWAKLDRNDFLYITTYENSNFAKPSLSYYEMIIKRLNLDPDETIMIGNDAIEDMVPKRLGIRTFLVTDCLNNKNNIDINQFEHGTLQELLEKIEKDLI
ncbi:MAG: HAD family hydrolase [Candidatus Izemoplasmatales bacterium]|nr:HAD family hydrolase [Candidatus Izemoplasmatales bacterium]